MTVAFVTDGTNEFSRKLCRILVRRGFSISFTYRGLKNEAHAALSEIESLGARAICLPVEDFSASELSAAVIETAERLGGIDALFYVYVHHAADKDENEELLLDVDDKDWDDAMNRGARGFFLSSKYSLPYLVSSGCGRVAALDIFPHHIASLNLAEHVSSHSLRTALEYISPELSNYGVSAIYRQISGEVDWAGIIMENTNIRDFQD
ncbi:MAG: SDR family NAD(P)-dependent oxidoreductase [Synergistaceae bacterium]|nr:SDR family NAD(P)-dependent oxidoreductase [Synergistaceae bacterium]